MDDVDPSRRLKGAEARLAEVQKLPFVELHGLLGDDESHDVLAKVTVRDTERGGLPDRGMALEDIINQSGRDVESTLDDELLGPPDDEVIAVLVHAGQVAGAQPAVGPEHGGGRLGVLEIARHDARTLEEDFARLSNGHRRTIRTDEFRLKAKGQPRRPDLVLARGKGIGEDVPTALCRTHGLDQQERELLLKRLVQGWSQRGRGGANEPDLAQRFSKTVLTRVFPVQELSDKRRDEGRPRAPVSG